MCWDEEESLLDNQTKLSFKKLRLYLITRVVSPLLYEVKLPKWLKIHPIISIEHREKQKGKKNDPYNRKLPGPGLIVVDGVKKYIIKHIERKEIRKDKGKRTMQPWYLCYYFSYDDPEWTDGKTLKQDVPDLLQKFEEDLRRSRQERQLTYMEGSVRDIVMGIHFHEAHTPFSKAQPLKSFFNGRCKAHNTFRL